MRLTAEFDVAVPMRDGTALSTNIWRPKQSTPLPVLLVRLPYSKDDYADMYTYLHPNVHAILKAGYAIAWQDCRGTHSSGRGFVPIEAEADDGVDTIEWLADQPWCDGSVGMYGASYMGMTQWLAASGAPTALRAIAPAVSSADFYRAPFYSPGGGLSLNTAAGWFRLIGLAELTTQPKSIAAGTTDAVESNNEPLGDIDLYSDFSYRDSPVFARAIPWGQKMLDHITQDRFWSDLSPMGSEAIAVPVLTIAGWFDYFLGESLRAHVRYHQNGNEHQQSGSRLIVGPWTHSNLTGSFPDVTYGPQATPEGAEITQSYLAFFDRWVKGADSAPALPPVKVFTMGINTWRYEQQWPLPDTIYTDFHLGGDGPAHGQASTGTLTRSEPQPFVDTFVYDPLDPVPTVGGVPIPLDGAMNGPADQGTLASRDDVLTYSTDVVTEPVDVTGPVTLTLFVSSSAVDTDFTAKLLDVYPDGRALLLCEGMLRMKFRDALQDPHPIQPGEIYEIRIDLLATSNVFLSGHRIRLEVSSSNFPRYDRNTNTDAASAAVGTVLKARNSIYRGPAGLSRLTLPIISR